MSAFSLSTSISLIRRVRAVEPGAWETLLKLYGPLVYRCARLRGLPSHDAADVIQNVFLKVWRGIHDFSLDQPGTSFRGWLRMITRNAVIDHQRRQQAQRTVVSNRIEVAAPTSDTLSDEELVDVTEEELFSELTRRALKLVRETVDSTTWDAFWNTTVLDHPVNDVAELLQMSPASVRQAKYRVLCRLRSLLADR